MHVLIGILALILVGNAMATPEQRMHSRSWVKRYAPHAGVAALVLWLLILLPM